jgi:protein-S-isoprenylcysteine O-methyltransferase Ste14
MHGTSLFGRLALLVFVYFIFAGPFDLAGISSGHAGWLAWDGLLSGLFFIQHSGMIRRRFRTWMAGRIPVDYHGALYTLASSLILFLVVLFWQASDLTLFALHGPLRWMARGFFFAAAAGTGWGYFSLEGFDPFGVGPLKARWSGKPLQTPPPSLTLRGPYRWVRHPLYFFILVMVWSCPDLAADRLLFNLLWTGWIIAGALFEERDLVAEFGDGYRAYQKKVPMLIPWKGRAARFCEKEKPPYSQNSR